MTISGHVYCDMNNNGILDAGEMTIANATLRLVGGVFDRTTTTNAAGFYEFTGIDPGTYTILETQPPGTTDGRDRVGTVNGQVRGTLGNDIISNIVLVDGDNGINYDFGEFCPPTKLSLLASSSLRGSSTGLLAAGAAATQSQGTAGGS